MAGVQPRLTHDGSLLCHAVCLPIMWGQDLASVAHVGLELSVKPRQAFSLQSSCLSFHFKVGSQACVSRPDHRVFTDLIGELGSQAQWHRSQVNSTGGLPWVQGQTGISPSQRKKRKNRIKQNYVWVFTDLQPHWFHPSALTNCPWEKIHEL